MDTPLPLLSEKFELLSAYLDGEVSPAERKQVEDWLASDVELKQTYQKMLALQGGLKAMPVASTLPTEQLVNQVMKRLDRQQQSHRWIWGGLGAAAALLVGAMSGLLTGNQNGTLQVAQQPKSQASSIAIPQPTTSATVAMQTGESVNARALMIVLERPPVEIPAVPASMRSNQGGEGL
jgi:anti-sigma factor RsiW